MDDDLLDEPASFCILAIFLALSARRLVLIVSGLFTTPPVRSVIRQPPRQTRRSTYRYYRSREYSHEQRPVPTSSSRERQQAERQRLQRQWESRTRWEKQHRGRDVHARNGFRLTTAGKYSHDAVCVVSHIHIRISLKKKER